MKKQLCLIFLGFLVIFFIDSCKKQSTNAPNPNSKVPDDVLSAINKMGFNSNDVHAFNNGYIVEGDIFIPKESLGKTINSANLIIAKTEQYQTFNLVKNLPRTVTISISNLPTVYVTAASNAVDRYNALNLNIKFQVVSSGGAIQIIGFDQGPINNFITLGFSGFPTLSGDPYNQIQMNTNSLAYGSNPNLGYVTSVIQHELGHCVGLRHTDYFNRAFSCGPNSNNVEHSNYDPSDLQNFPGAINIPGTPTTEDAGSLMLACNNGVDRPFNPNDIVALNYLYGTPSQTISGASTICTSNADPYLYTINNLPAGVTVTWSTLYAIKIVGSNSGNPVSIEYTPAGSQTKGILTATLSTGVQISKAIFHQSCN